MQPDELHLLRRDAAFPALLTARTLGAGADSATYLYSWTEQGYDPDGRLVSAVMPRGGDASFSPAVEVNNLAVPVPWYVWLRLATSVGGNLRYEFDGAGAAGGDSTSLTYNDSTFTFTQNDWRFLFATLLDVYNALLVSNPSSSTFGYVDFQLGVILCSWLYWCCNTITFPGGTITDYGLGTPGAPVYTFTGGGSLHSIIPALQPQVLQTNDAEASGSTSIAVNLPLRTQTGGGVVVTVTGRSAAALTSRAVSDSQGNTYTETVFTRNATGGAYAGVYVANGITGGSPLSCTFSFSGTPGPIVATAEEVANIKGITATTSSSIGTGGTAVPGPAVGGGPNLLTIMAACSDDTTTAATVGTPAGFTPLHTETNGAAFAAGLAAYRLGATLGSGNPSVTLTGSEHWAAVQAVFGASASGQLLTLVNAGGDTLALVHRGTASTGRQIYLPSAWGHTAGSSSLPLAPGDSAILWLNDCEEVGAQLARWWVLATTAVPPGSGTSTLTTTDGTNTDPNTDTIWFGPGITYTKGTGGRAGNDTASLTGLTGNYPIVTAAWCDSLGFHSVTTTFSFTNGLLTSTS